MWVDAYSDEPSPNPWINAMRSHHLSASLFTFLPLLLPAPALAQWDDVRSGQLMVNQFNASAFGDSSSVRHDPGGVEVGRTAFSGTEMEGIILTASGRIASARRLATPPHIIEFYDPNTGLLSSSGPIPHIQGKPGDLAIFSDGIIAVVGQEGSIELYDEALVHQGTLTASGLGHPFGIHVDRADTLWAANYATTAKPNHRIVRWHKDGTVLQNWVVNFTPTDLVVDRDGTLWIASRDTHRIRHFTPDGNLLGSFIAPLDSTSQIYSIAMGPAGSLYLCAYTGHQVFRYTRGGDLIDQFPIDTSFGNLFLTVIPGADVGDAYCVSQPNSTGQAASISAYGSTSIAASSLGLWTDNVPDEFGIFFSGTGQVQVPFGDGFLCANGAIVRGTVVRPFGASASYLWDLGDEPGVAGATRYFQYWFRDPAAGGAGFNTSDGLAVTSTP